MHDLSERNAFLSEQLRAFQHKDQERRREERIRELNEAREKEAASWAGGRQPQPTPALPVTARHSSSHSLKDEPTATPFQSASLNGPPSIGAHLLQSCIVI